MGTSTMDIEDRDPNSLNPHLQVLWSDVIGEPEGVRSPDCAWRLSSRCFKHSRNCCYLVMSVLFAPLTALCLGMTFACLAFDHIWCVAPCLRVYKITCAATRNFVSACTYAIVAPCTQALGYFWSNVRVQHQKLSGMNDGLDREQNILII